MKTKKLFLSPNLLLDEFDGNRDKIPVFCFPGSCKLRLFDFSYGKSWVNVCFGSTTAYFLTRAPSQGRLVLPQKFSDTV